MTRIYGDFDESLFSDFAASSKESLDDLGKEQQDKDRILFDVDYNTYEPELRVDFSDFSKHVFFGSAYASVGFGINRIYEDYPYDGELKDVNAWKKLNSGYENWFFENYPKRQGYVFFTTGSSADCFVHGVDYKNQINFGTSSVSVEFVVQPNINPSPNAYQYIFDRTDATGNNGLAIVFSGSKNIVFSLRSGSVHSNLSLNYNPYISSSHNVAYVYDQPNQIHYAFVDNILLASASVSSFDNIFVNKQQFTIAASSISSSYSYLFSGAIDDFRFWNQNRKEFLSKTFYKSIYANHSGGLQLYYKFNEPTEYGNKIIDYSGNQIDGALSGAYSVSVNKISGTLGAWFKDEGDVILSLSDSDVQSFLNQQLTSSVLYDKSNRNCIFNLIPSFFIDEEDSEIQQRFLLLIARHYDKLKLYIEHLSSVYNTNVGDFNTTPDAFLNYVATNYGIDIGSIYEDADVNQYFYGEDVLTTGSLATPIEQIRNQLKRNVLNNLIYLIKTKSTRESLLAAFRTLGIDNEAINVNEYSILSGAIETSYEPATVERRVAKFLTSSNVFITSSALSSANTSVTQEIRVRFNTASVNLSQSIYAAYTATGDKIYEIYSIRDAVTSSYGKIVSQFAPQPAISCSSLHLFDNNWINIAFSRNTATNTTSLLVSKLNKDELEITGAIATSSVGTLSASGAAPRLILGSSGSRTFDGWMQEYRSWKNYDIAPEGLLRNVFVNHAKDFDSVEVLNFTTDLNFITSRLKLNDLTASATGGGPIHDYVTGLSGSSFAGFTTSSTANFPGQFIDKLKPSYSYDIAINNSKIRVKEDTFFNKNDVTKDIPYVSVDVSPVASLNKEIMSWIGDLSKFSSIVGMPYLRYRDEVDTLNLYRTRFFEDKINNKINFINYLNLIKWFDNNFSCFLQQMLPLDVTTHLADFVVEPHLLEFNQVKRQFPFSEDKQSTTIGSTLQARPDVSVTSFGQNIGLGDPGRYGAAANARGEVGQDAYINYTASYAEDNNINFKNEEVRKDLSEYYRQNGNNYAPDGYGNGFYSKLITGSNYLKNTLNVYENSTVSDINYVGGPGGTTYPSASRGQPLSATTSSMALSFNQRWAWDISGSSAAEFQLKYNEFGLGYGGGYGQLYENRVRKGSPNPILVPVNTFAFSKTTDVPYRVLEIKGVKTAEYNNIILWPAKNDFDGVKIIFLNNNNATGSFVSAQGTATGLNTAYGFGDPINIEGYRKLNMTFTGRSDQSLPDAIVMGFLVKFQFFDNDIPGSDAFESIISSSFESGKPVTKTVQHEYQILANPKETTSGNHVFTVNVERELPANKNMRLFVTVITDNSALPSDGATYTIVFKGILSKEKETFNDGVINLRRA